MKRIQGFVCGFLTAIVLLISLPALAESIQATFNVINIKINGALEVKAGESFALANGEKVPYTIVYNGTTYLPLREMVRLVGKDLVFDGKTSTADIVDKPIEQPKAEGAIMDDVLKDIFGEVALNKYGLPDFNSYQGTHPKPEKRDDVDYFIYNGAEYVSIQTVQPNMENPLVPKNYWFQKTFIDGKISDIIQFVVKDLETGDVVVLIEEVPYTKTYWGYFIQYDYYLNAVSPLTK